MTHADEAAQRIYEAMRLFSEWEEGEDEDHREQARMFARIGFNCAAQYLDELVATRAEQGIRRGGEYLTAAAAAIRVRVGL